MLSDASCYSESSHWRKDWMESTAYLEMAAKGNKNSCFPNCSQLMILNHSVCIQTVTKKGLSASIRVVHFMDTDLLHRI
jgi:hypothetical protein